MKLAYQVATPDVRPAPGVTAWQSGLEEGFRRLHEVGYDGAELMVCDPAAVDAQKVEALAKQYGLELPMICTGEVFGQDGLTFSTLDDAAREEALRRAKAAVDLAARLSAQVNIGRLRGGYVWGAPAWECRRRSVDGLRQVARYARQMGVTVALEPVNSLALNFVNTTQDGLAMVEEVGNPAMRLMLDSSHMFIEDRDMAASIFEAKAVTAYVHLTDSNRLYPGNCKLDFKGFLDTLKESGYDGWLGVEVFQRPDAETALFKSYAHIRPLL